MFNHFHDHEPSIALDKHSKIWIHPKGIIPVKIYNRLIFQREIRPEDSLTLFINRECLEGSKSKLDVLKKSGIKIKVIEDSLDNKEDNEYLISLVKKILEELSITHDVRYSVFASDILRLMNIVQNEGLYSDTDVLFLNQQGIPNQLLTTHLFGCHHEDLYSIDIHIFAVAKEIREQFNEKLISALKNIYGYDITAETKLTLISGIVLFDTYDILDQDNHGHLSFDETKDNVISGKDNSHCGGEEALYNDDEIDEMLEIAKQKIEILKNNLSRLNTSRGNHT